MEDLSVKEPVPKKPFARSREMLKSHTPQQVLGIISLFAVAYTMQSLLHLFLSGFLSWTFTILPIGLLSYIYNALAQASGKVIKYALILDWLELSILNHIYIIIGSICALVVSNLFITTSASATDHNYFQFRKKPDLLANNPIHV